MDNLVHFAVFWCGRVYRGWKIIANTRIRDWALSVFNSALQSASYVEVDLNDGVNSVHVPDAEVFVFWSLQDDLSVPLLEENLDGSSGVIFPFYDPDTHMLYLAGKVGLRKWL